MTHAFFRVAAVALMATMPHAPRAAQEAVDLERLLTTMPDRFGKHCTITP